MTEADVGRMSSSGEDLRVRGGGATAVRHAMGKRPVGAGSSLGPGASTNGPGSRTGQRGVRSKQPRAFNRGTPCPSARRIADHLGPGQSWHPGELFPHIDDDGAQRGHVRVQRAVEQADRGDRWCESSASPSNGAGCCARRRRSPRRTRPCWSPAIGHRKEVVARFIDAASARGAGHSSP